ncbi:MAG: phosphate starvation-inducible protein PsiF [Afipia sp.]|nr:phosphate starvation-inducible protein PsiF [Afipia sp.]
MTTFTSRLLVTAAASLMLAGSAFAQTTAPATPATPSAKTAPAKMEAPKAKPERTAASLECSKQADAKGLHGKERKKFRSDCKKNAGKAN